VFPPRRRVGVAVAVQSTVGFLNTNGFLGVPRNAGSAPGPWQSGGVIDAVTFGEIGLNLLIYWRGHRQRGRPRRTACGENRSAQDPSASDFETSCR